MHYKGINYDIGTYFTKDHVSREVFDLNIVQKEIEIIRQELNCNAIRISGQDVERLSKASEIALTLGLTVFFSPALINATQLESLDYFSQCALAAEELRKKNPNVIFVVGCECSLFTQGFVKGSDIYKRMKRMFNLSFIIRSILHIRGSYNKKLNAFLENAVKTVRNHFKGQVTYASGTWEDVNWDLFDIVGIDHYRASYNKTFYRKQLSNYLIFNKPIAVLEFGCCTYKGAEDKGGSGWAIIDWSKAKPELNKDYIRDEEVQANYITELLDIFKEENVFAALVFTFVNPANPYNNDTKFDLDMASYSIVKTLEKPGNDSYKGMPWVPKKAFYSLAKYYEGL